MYFRVYKTTVEQLFCVENEWIVHILCCFFKVVQRVIWAAIFLHVKSILRAPFLPRAPPFYTAHARLSTFKAFMITCKSDCCYNIGGKTHGGHS